MPRMRLPTEETDNADDEWLGTFEDDLTMAIAVRDWDQAVVLVNKGMARRPRGFLPLVLCTDYVRHLTQAKHTSPVPRARAGKTTPGHLV